MIARAEKEIEPRPLIPIPDDPLPHEGAMVEFPYVVEPPDFLVVEVLEGLPGRPITGTRLVRPDGTITLGFYGNLYVKGLTPQQIKAKIAIHLRKYLPDENLGLLGINPDTREQFPIDPADSDRIFVDLDGYNSKHYHVEGDVGLPGRYPWTGNETVLDAMDFVGGFTPTADLDDIRVVRPARGGKPARTYKIDWAAIRDRGDATANLQLFPDDRLVVGRNPGGLAAVEHKRTAELLSLELSPILSYGFAIKTLDSAQQNATPRSDFNFTLKLGKGEFSFYRSPDGPAIAPAQREAVLKGFADAWWGSPHPEGAKLDEKTFREGLIRSLDPPSPQPARSN